MLDAATPMFSLGNFLREAKNSVHHVDGPISTAYDITALQYAIGELGRFPVIYAEKPLLMDGTVSDIPLVCNLTASRELTAQSLGLDDHRYAARAYADRTSATIEPVIVASADAPVQEVVLCGDDADLTRLPAVRQHILDPGPYLTSAHATTYDPETGIDNTAIQRCWVKGPKVMSYFPYPSSHNARNMRKFWSRGEACPVAFWIGHHPAVLMGTQAKLKYPESHWGATGGLIGEPLRMVPSVTHGSDIMVPADAEIVIEGWVPADVLQADGPFGEYTGYSGPQTPAPICEITCITRRRNAIYHDYGSGLPDMLVPDNMVMEGKLFSMVRGIAPSVSNIHVPNSGRRFHAYIQLDKPSLGEARDALTSVLSYRRIKTAVAVDTDVDIFSDSDVMWALATRVQWNRDSFSIDGLSGSMLDPSMSAGARTTSKLAIDATMPATSVTGAPNPVPPRARVPDDAAGRARDRLDGIDFSRWPVA